MEPPLLWHFPISHFNEKVRWALDWKGIAHRREVIGPTYLFRAPLASGQMSLPILFLEGRAVADSTRIIQALERLQPEPALLPADDAELRRALELEDFFDEELGHPLRSAIIGDAFERDPGFGVEMLATGMSPGARAFMEAAGPVFRFIYRRRHGIDDETRRQGHEKMEAALTRLETELGDRRYLVGDSFSVADLTAASLFCHMAAPPELEYPVPSGAPGWLAELLVSFASRPGTDWVREMYRLHRGKSAAVAG